MTKAIPIQPNRRDHSTFLNWISWYPVRSWELNFAVLAGLGLLLGTVAGFVDGWPIWIGKAGFAVAYFFGARYDWPGGRIP